MPNLVQENPKLIPQKIKRILNPKTDAQIKKTVLKNALTIQNCDTLTKKLNT